MVTTSRLSFIPSNKTERLQEEETREAQTVFEGIAEARDTSLMNYHGRILYLLCYCRLW